MGGKYKYLSQSGKGQKMVVTVKVETACFSNVNDTAKH